MYNLFPMSTSLATFLHCPFAYCLPFWKHVHDFFIFTNWPHMWCTRLTRPPTMPSTIFHFPQLNWFKNKLSQSKMGTVAGAWLALHMLTFTKKSPEPEQASKKNMKRHTRKQQLKLLAIKLFYMAVFLFQIDIPGNSGECIELVRGFRETRANMFIELGSVVNDDPKYFYTGFGSKSDTIPNINILFWTRSFDIFINQSMAFFTVNFQVKYKVEIRRHYWIIIGKVDKFAAFREKNHSWRH